MLPPTTHLILAAIGGGLFVVAVYLLVKWINDRINPPRKELWDEVWIGDTIEGTWKGIPFKSKVTGIEGTGGKNQNYRLIVVIDRQKIRIDFKNKKAWRKVS